ncbi:perlucin-like isoform X2 [Aedes albopictus]|uniref:C-type lectin domain-containing protein n=1 Tax=Aedes albopictus TaxID=7160 RepID=A0ABM1Y4P9_AEDAL|nr:perlucin-like isoform X2 [Aedes albopictus]
MNDHFSVRAPVESTMHFRLRVLLSVLFLAVATNCVDFCVKTPLYYIPRVSTDWIGAVEYYNRLNMRLAIVDSQEKHDNIVELIKASDVFVPNATSVWIGANDISTEGTFVWLATGQRANYTNWSVGNPNNHAGREHCAEIAYQSYTRWTWTWNDHKCDTKLNLIY